MTDRAMHLAAAGLVAGLLSMALPAHGGSAAAAPGDAYDTTTTTMGMLLRDHCLPHITSGAEMETDGLLRLSHQAGQRLFGRTAGRVYSSAGATALLDQPADGHCRIASFEADATDIHAYALATIGEDPAYAEVHVEGDPGGRFTRVFEGGSADRPVIIFVSTDAARRFAVISAGIRE